MVLVCLLAFFAIGENKTSNCPVLCLSLCGLDVFVCICLFVCFSVGDFLQLATTKPGFYDFCVDLCVVLDVFVCVFLFVCFSVGVFCNW